MSTTTKTGNAKRYDLLAYDLVAAIILIVGILAAAAIVLIAK